ncbi:MAG: hypothetical protein MUP58_01360, partial [Candidatus Nanohaloarchaeota archaeon QJJ-9]|nr:hypothetical protein [Candidatus Nanohaloarchaeota archaeon QJJ-9]
MASWNILHKDWKAIWKNIRKGRWQRIWEGILRYFYRIIPHDGVKVVDEEWDYLIILDACRYDIFKEVNEIEGELKKKTSRGSTTIEFLNRNFTDYYDDIVYISGNGFVNPFDIHEENYQRENFDSSKHFYKVVPTYLEEENYEYDNVGLKPEAVIDKALEAEERFPEKRKIIHFMQPHTPFIGEYQLTKENNGYLELIDKGFSREEIRKAY